MKLHANDYVNMCVGELYLHSFSEVEATVHGIVVKQLDNMLQMWKTQCVAVVVNIAS